MANSLPTEVVERSNTFFSLLKLLELLRTLLERKQTIRERSVNWPVGRALLAIRSKGRIKSVFIFLNKVLKKFQESFFFSRMSVSLRAPSFRRIGWLEVSGVPRVSGAPIQKETSFLKNFSLTSIMEVSILWMSPSMTFKL